MRGATVRQLRRLAGSDRNKFKRLKKEQNNKFRPTTYKPEDHNPEKGWNREDDRRRRFDGNKSQTFEQNRVGVRPTSGNHNPSHDAKESNHARTIRTRTISGRRFVDNDEVVKIRHYPIQGVRRFKNGKEVGDGGI